MLLNLKHHSIKKRILLTLIFGAVIIADYNFDSVTQNQNLNEARFLGTGKKVERTDCFMGTRWKITTYTVLWIRIGGETWEKESC